MAVLILTRRTDATADLVVRELDRRQVPVVRMDPADLLKDGQLTAHIDGSTRQWVGELTNADGRTVPLEEVSSIYWRRPTPIVDETADVSMLFAQRETEAAFMGVLWSLEATWLNDPHDNRRANSKLLQLRLAALCGLDIPSSLVTDQASAARPFAAQQDIVYKHIGNSPPLFVEGKPAAIYTTVVKAEDINDSVSVASHLFQQRIRKTFEVRLTVVGTKMFAGRINWHSEAASVDFRADYANLTYENIDIPPEVKAGVSRLMSSLNLLYGALDFVVDEDKWVFLEVNPNGQWAWIAAETNAPVTSAIADLLEEPCPTHAPRLMHDSDDMASSTHLSPMARCLPQNG